MIPIVRALNRGEEILYRRLVLGRFLDELQLRQGLREGGSSSLSRVVDYIESLDVDFIDFCQSGFALRFESKSRYLNGEGEAVKVLGFDRVLEGFGSYRNEEWEFLPSGSKCELAKKAGALGEQGFLEWLRVTGYGLGDVRFSDVIGFGDYGRLSSKLIRRSLESAFVAHGWKVCGEGTASHFFLLKEEGGVRVDVGVLWSGSRQELIYDVSVSVYGVELIIPSRWEPVLGLGTAVWDQLDVAVFDAQISWFVNRVSGYASVLEEVGSLAVGSG